MTIRHLTIFQAVCRANSITRAAEVLNMTQPSVSMAIRELECFYSTKLFERMNRKIYITLAGEELLAYANNILYQLDEVKSILKDTEATSRIRIGGNIAYGTNYLPSLLKQFCEQYPMIPMYTVINNSSRIEKSILQNELDFAIVDNRSNETQVVYQKIMEEPMCMVGSQSFYTRYVGEQVDGPLPLEGLSLLPLLVRESGSGLRTVVEEVYKSKGLNMHIVVESASTQALIALCKIGQGLLIVPRFAVQDCIERGELVEIQLTDRQLTRSYYLIYHKNKFLTRSMQVFLDFVSHLTSSVE